MTALGVEAGLPGATGSERPEAKPPPARARRRGTEAAEETAGGATGFEKAMRREALRTADRIEPPAEGFAPFARPAPSSPAAAPGETEAAEPTPRHQGEERPARVRPGSAGRSAPEPGPGALLQAAAAGAGLAPRQATAPGAGPGGAEVSHRSGTVAGSTHPELEGAESSAGPQGTEEARRPLHEAAGPVPGWKAPALPSSAASDGSSATAPSTSARSVGGAATAGAPTPGHSVDLRAQDGAGVTGAILQSAAHLRIEGVPGGIGDIELHLRVRGDVTHVRIDGEAGRIASLNAPELATALASAGLSLGRLDTPPVAAPSAATPSGAFGQRSGGDPGANHSQSQSQGQPEPHLPGQPPPSHQPRSTRDASGRSTTRGGRVHVEA